MKEPVSSGDGFGLTPCVYAKSVGLWTSSESPRALLLTLEEKRKNRVVRALKMEDSQTSNGLLPTEPGGSLERACQRNMQTFPRMGPRLQMVIIVLQVNCCSILVGQYKMTVHSKLLPTACSIQSEMRGRVEYRAVEAHFILNLGFRLA